MSTPKRIQRKRTKGWRMPDGVVYVGRPTKWGNPYRVDIHRNVTEAVGAYQSFCEQPENRADIRAQLKGHDLACWCPLDQPCHADVLLQVANEAKL